MENRKFLSCFICSLLIISSFFSCDKFDLDFTTDSKFYLDASSHELEIKTKQEGAFINRIFLNDEPLLVSCRKVECEEMVDFEICIVYYFSNGVIKEIEGEWFNLKVADNFTYNISISENHTGKKRSLIIDLIWKSAKKQIVIDQKEGGMSEKTRYTSFAEAKEISNLFMDWKLGGSKTKSGSERIVQETSTIKSDNEDLMYIFNYNEGFTAVSSS